MQIRAENAADQAEVAKIVEDAFESTAEAGLVDALRSQATPLVSLVAEDKNAIIGHIMFSPVSLADYPHISLMGLAPMAVDPKHQRSGIGSALIRAGLRQCRDIGTVAIVVLGHPEYYPRFGFVPASRFDLGCEYDVPDEVFMAIELQEGSLKGASGIIKYHEAFSSL